MNVRNAGILLGVPLDRKSLSATISDAVAAIEHRTPVVIFACANPHSLVTAQRDAVFRFALNNATQVVADGVGVTMMARWAGVLVGPRITGTDYFVALMKALQSRGGGNVFFFGSSPDVLALIVQKARSEFPAVTVCGAKSPPFLPWSPEENAAIIETINNAKPDVLWVGMTAPKQEKWVEENRHQLGAPVIASIGAVFDFYAGTRPRAPRWMCRLGLEWLHRLLKEPRRMWRRTFVSAPKFVVLVIWRHVLGNAERRTARIR